MSKVQRALSKRQNNIAYGKKGLTKSYRNRMKERLPNPSSPNRTLYKYKTNYDAILIRHRLMEKTFELRWKIKKRRVSEQPEDINDYDKCIMFRGSNYLFDYMEAQGRDIMENMYVKFTCDMELFTNPYIARENLTEVDKRVTFDHISQNF